MCVGFGKKITEMRCHVNYIIAGVPIINMMTIVDVDLDHLAQVIFAGFFLCKVIPPTFSHTVVFRRLLKSIKRIHFCFLFHQWCPFFFSYTLRKTLNLKDKQGSDPAGSGEQG